MVNPSWNEFEEALLMSLIPFKFHPDPARSVTWEVVASRIAAEMTRRGIPHLRAYAANTLAVHWHRHKDRLIAEWGEDGVQADTFITAIDVLTALPNSAPNAGNPGA